LFAVDVRTFDALEHLFQSFRTAQCVVEFCEAMVAQLLAKSPKTVYPQAMTVVTMFLPLRLKQHTGKILNSRIDPETSTTTAVQAIFIQY